MRGLSRKETIGVAGVALAAVAVTWFSVAMSRPAGNGRLPECTEVYSPGGADALEASGRDSLPPEGRETARRAADKGGGKKGARRKGKGHGKNVNKNKTRSDRSFLDEKL